MPRRTLAQALDDSARITTSLNIDASDPRVTDYINRFIERALPRGHWWGTSPKVVMSVTEQLVTLPPQFATMEKVAVAQSPIPLRNQWYEFMAYGNGVINDPSSGTVGLLTNQGLFRGTFPVFKDIVSTGAHVTLQCDLADDVGEVVLVLGYDENGNWIRTKPAATWIDGERIALAQSPGTLSTKQFSKISGIQKPATDGQIWLYQTVGSTNTLIGNYQHFETDPAYSRYLLPIIPNTATQVDLIGKLAFIPAVNPTDYLIISNLEALRLGCMALKAEEEGFIPKASVLMNGKRDAAGRIIQDGAITILDSELQHYTGDGTTPVTEFPMSVTGERVEALI